MTQNANSEEQKKRSPFILALDVGTSSTRALLFDETGTAVRGVQSQHTYELTVSKEGEVSIDADKLVELVAQTIDEALKAAGSLANAIGAVATDTFWHGIVGVDDSGHPVTPVITWEDTRPRQAAAELRSQLNETEIHKRNGALLHASYWPAKLRWLSQVQPETFGRAAQWLSFGEYMHRQFLGRSVCSLSMASGTGLLVTRDHTWDTELLAKLGVSPDHLPPLGDLHDSIQGLTSQYAARWPALHTVPWFPAIGDGAAANIGSGATNSDNWALTVGTSSAMRVVVPPDEIFPPSGLWLYLIDARRGLLGGALSEGGNLFAWMNYALRLPPLSEAESLVAELRPDGHGLTILPFISGERSLGWHAEALASVVGIRTHTTPAELLRASIEALAYQLSAVYEALNNALERNEAVPTVIASGGALLGSHTLQSVVADTLDTPLYPSLDHEASARGAALLALEALGVVSNVTQFPVNLGEPILPDTARHGIYQSAADRQRRLYHLLLDGPQVF